MSRMIGLRCFKDASGKLARFPMFAVSGAVTVSIERGDTLTEYVLDFPERMLYVPEAMWIKVYAFRKGAVLMCFSDKRYADYECVEDYEEYRSRLKR